MYGCTYGQNFLSSNYLAQGLSLYYQLGLNFVSRQEEEVRKLMVFMVVHCQQVAFKDCLLFEVNPAQGSERRGHSEGSVGHILQPPSKATVMGRKLTPPLLAPKAMGLKPTSSTQVVPQQSTLHTICCSM